MFRIRCALVALVAVTVLGCATKAPPSGSTTDAHEAIAFGLLLDARPSADSLAEGVRIAEALRVKYGIDSGDVVADRMAAARRAEQEVLAPLEPSIDEIRSVAAEFGYDLDPTVCGNRCENFRRLAVLEIHKRALVAFATGS